MASLRGKEEELCGKQDVVKYSCAAGARFPQPVLAATMTSGPPVAARQHLHLQAGTVDSHGVPTRTIASDTQAMTSWPTQHVQVLKKKSDTGSECLIVASPETFTARALSCCASQQMPPLSMNDASVAAGSSPCKWKGWDWMLSSKDRQTAACTAKVGLIDGILQLHPRVRDQVS